MLKPETLYKYRSFNEYSLFSLINENLWLPKPSQLNDPFDGQLKLNSLEMSFQEFKSELSGFLSAFTNGSKMDIDFDRMKNMWFSNNQPNEYFKQKAKKLEEVWNHDSENVGVYSLSEDPTNSTMWSHYAAEHSGFCIGLNPKILFQSSSFGEVKYVEDTMITRNAYLMIASVFTLNSIKESDLFINSLFQKNKDWKYEKEWRFSSLSAGGKPYIFDLKSITSISFGLNTEPESKKAIWTILNSKGIQPTYYQMIRHKFNLGLDREIINLESAHWSYKANQ